MTGSGSLVSGVDFVVIPTQDFARATEFYGTTLGLLCSVRYDKVDGAEFETGTLTLQVLDASVMPGDFSPNRNPIALHVDDVEHARSELESRGVSFFGKTIDSGVCHMTFFTDPDGNGLMLHHRYAPRE